MAHCDEVCAVSGIISTSDVPPFSGLVSTADRAAALQENQRLCLNCRETLNYFKQRKPPFTKF